MKNILVIEDWQPIAKAIRALLRAAGHQVTWLVGADSYQTTDGGVILRGLTADGKTQEVDCRQFQLAFVDGQLEGQIQGPALVELLAQSKVACCGMSTVPELNNEMLAKGATMAFKKPVIFAAILSTELSADAVLTPTQPVLSSLSSLESHFTLPQFASLRKQADACLGRFMLGAE